MTKKTRTMLELICLGGLTVAGLCLSSCTTSIVPPADPVDPVSVYVIDYGRHTSLMLPRDEGGPLVEYAYGEWNWFALDYSNWYNVFGTLLWPTQGALGRWEWDIAPDPDAIRARIVCDDVLEIDVAGEKKRALLDRLDARHTRRIDTLHHQPLYQLDFVHDDDKYHALHNCNHVLAQWLRELDCEVHGWSMFATFVVHERDK